LKYKFSIHEKWREQKFECLTLIESCLNEFEVSIFNISKAWPIHFLEIFPLIWFFLVFKSKSIRKISSLYTLFWEGEDAHVKFIISSVLFGFIFEGDEPIMEERG